LVFGWHLLADACHMPPAFSHSVFVLAFVTSLEVPDGLAAGDVDEPPDGIVPLDFPDGVLELPAFPLLPLPVVCATASAGVNARIPTKSASISLRIAAPPVCERVGSSRPSGQQYPGPGRRRVSCRRPGETVGENIGSGELFAE
jgi:hypothetical protein